VLKPWPPAPTIADAKEAGNEKTETETEIGIGIIRADGAARMGENGLVAHAALEEVTETGETTDERKVKRITGEKKTVEIVIMTVNVSINVITTNGEPLHGERTASDTKTITPGTLSFSTTLLLPNVSHPQLSYTFLDSNI